MIALLSKMDSSPFPIVEHAISQDGRFGWFLAIWHPQNEPVLDELGAEIRLAIRNSEAASISKAEVEKWLKSFFNDLHWKLYGMLMKTSLQEKGISLFFGVMYDHELFFVQFGRMFCAITDHKKLKQIGNSYREQQMQSLEKLNLLGFQDRDISVRPQRIFIGEHQRFIAISGNLAAKVFEGVSDLATIDHYVESFVQVANPLWLILEGKARLIQPVRRKLSRVQISSLVILSVTVLAIVYMLFGNRFLDQLLLRTRMSVKHNRTLRLEQIPNTLSIDTQNLLKYMERIVNLPARNIELEIVWSADLPYTVTSPPVYSLDTIFLTAENNLLAFDKKNQNLRWKKSFAQPITSLIYNETTLLVCLKDDEAFGFKEDGTQIWQQEMDCSHQINSSFTPSVINPEEDPRLDRAITVIPSERSISILDAPRGESLSSITFKEQITNLSSYDSYANCFYAVMENAILCIQLKIVN